MATNRNNNNQKFAAELPKYTTDHYCPLAEVKDKLARDGVAVVRNALTPDELTQARQLKWKMLSELSSGTMKESDPKTWDFLFKLYPLHSMLIQHWGVGHSELAWHIRQAPGVADVFARVWDSEPEDLITSFDGLSVHLPPETTGRGWYRGSNWLHADQAPARPGLECVQGLVNLYDVRPGDATLKVIRGSHKYRAEYAAKFGKQAETDDWDKVNDTELVWFMQQPGCKEDNVLANAGDLVLWDSRALHCGLEAVPCRQQPNYRTVVYVCMLPRSTATPKAMQKRLDAFKNLRTTTHWPNKAKLFPKTPRTYGGALPQVGKLTAPTISAHGRRLIGFEN